MWSTFLLPSLPDPIWLGMIVPDIVLSMGRIRVNCVLIQHLMMEVELFLIFDLCTYVNLIYIQQLCEDTGCNPEDLPEAMSDREKWQERVRDIRAGGTT